jgi:ketosteroid isomerase-like protein
MTTATRATIPIPTVIVPHACEAALYMLGLAADEIGKQSDQGATGMSDALALFDARRNLFETLRQQTDPGVEIDEAQRHELFEALRDHTAVTAGQVKTATEEGHMDEARKHARDLAELTEFVEKLTEAAAVCAESRRSSV